MQQYRLYLVKQMDRLLNLLDKDPSSPTYGCFDRTFWHYKYAKDFPDAMFQSNALSLAIFYRTDFPGNQYFSNSIILEFVMSSIRYAIKIQNSNGSWSEAYPNEYSYVATSFVLYNITKALLLIKDNIEEEDLTCIKRSLDKAKKWLNNYKGTIHAANQLAAKISAVSNLNILLGVNVDSKNLGDLDTLYSMQHPTQGWFREYGGFDLGYSSLCLHFLADIYNNFDDHKLGRSIILLLGALKQYADFRYFGNIGSRNTSYFVPGGLRICQDDSLERLLDRLSKMQVLGPHSFDDKYFAEYFSSYAECILTAKPKTIADTLPVNQGSSSGNIDQDIRTFEIADIDKIAINLKRCARWTNLDGTMFFNGYLLFYRDSYFTLHPEGQYQAKKQSFEIPCRLSRVKHSFPLVNLGIILIRIFNYTLCRISFINRLLDNILKKRFFIAGASGGLRATRTICLEDKSIIITDKFASLFPAGTVISTGLDFSCRNISSSKFDVPLSSQFRSTATSSFNQLEITFNFKNKQINLRFMNHEKR